MSTVSRRIVIPAVIGLALCALALVAACAMNRGPEREYRERTSSMDAPALHRERLALVQRLRTLDAEREQLAPEAADEATALATRREDTAEKLAHVNTLLAKGDFPVHDLRYKLDAPTLAAEAEQEPPAPEQQNAEPPAAAAPVQAEIAAHADAGAPADAPSAATAQAPEATLQATVASVEWTAQSDGILVSIGLSQESTATVRTFTLDSPTRHVVDVLDVTQPPVALPSRLSVESAAASAIRIGWHPTKGFIRIVVDGSVASSASSPVVTPGRITFFVSR